MKKMNNKGFSLVELIIVIAIMAVLVGVLAPQFLRYVEQSRVQKDESSMGEVNNAVKIACSMNDVYDGIGSGTNFTFGTADINNGAWGTPVAALNSELAKTIPEFKKFASKKYQSSPATCTVSVDAGAGTVKVTTTNGSFSVQ